MLSFHSNPANQWGKIAINVLSHCQEITSSELLRDEYIWVINVNTTVYHHATYCWNSTLTNEAEALAMAANAVVESTMVASFLEGRDTEVSA